MPSASSCTGCWKSWPGTNAGDSLRWRSRLPASRETPDAPRPPLVGNEKSTLHAALAVSRPAAGPLARVTTLAIVAVHRAILQPDDLVGLLRQKAMRRSTMTVAGSCTTA